jgi:hypothetical protein
VSNADHAECCRAGKVNPVTIHDRLVSLGAGDREARDAEMLLARVVPLGRPVVLTDEVVAAARAGDAALVATLLAEAVEPEADEIAALADTSESGDGHVSTLDEVRRELRIS